MAVSRPMIVLTLVAALLAGCGHSRPKGPLPFSMLSFDDAARAATAQHKLLLVDAMASWCPPCQDMERNTWPDTAVAAWLAAHAIAVQVDVDKDQAHAESLRIEKMPTLILFRDGTELGRNIGGMGPTQLLKWLALYVP
jgi:thiol-disulfide isomerase/thioredoxin